MDRIIGFLGGLLLAAVALAVLATLAPDVVETIWPIVLPFVQFLVIAVLGGGILAFAVWKFSDR